MIWQSALVEGSVGNPRTTMLKKLLSTEIPLPRWVRPLGLTLWSILLGLFVAASAVLTVQTWQHNAFFEEYGLGLPELSQLKWIGGALTLILVAVCFLGTRSCMRSWKEFLTGAPRSTERP